MARPSPSRTRRKPPGVEHAGPPSLVSLASPRMDARRRPVGNGRDACELAVIEDERRWPGAVHAEVCRGPDGLR